MKLKTRKSAAEQISVPRRRNEENAADISVLSMKLPNVAEMSSQNNGLSSIVGCADLSSAIKLSTVAKFDDATRFTSPRTKEVRKRKDKKHEKKDHSQQEKKKSGNKQLDSVLNLPVINKSENQHVTENRKRGSKLLRSASFALGTKDSVKETPGVKKGRLTGLLGGQKVACYFGMGGKMMKRLSMGGRLGRRNALTPLENTPEEGSDTLTKDAGSTPQNRYRLVPLNNSGILTRSASKKRQSLSKSFNALNISTASSGENIFNITAPAASVLDATAYTLDSYVRSPDCIADLTLTSEFFLTPDNSLSNPGTIRKRSMENLTLFEMPEKNSFEMPEKLSPLEVDQLLQSWPPVISDSDISKNVDHSEIPSGIDEPSHAHSERLQEASVASQDNHIDHSPIAPCRSYLDYVKAQEAGEAKNPALRTPHAFTRRTPRMGVLSRVTPLACASFTEGVTTHRTSLPSSPKLSNLQKTPNPKSASKRKASLSPRVSRNSLSASKKRCRSVGSLDKIPLALLTPKSGQKRVGKSPVVSRTPRSARSLAHNQSPLVTCMRRTPRSATSRASPRVTGRSSSARQTGQRSPSQKSVKTPRSASRRRVRSSSVTQRTPRARSSSGSHRSVGSTVKKSQGKRVKIARRESIIIRERPASALKRAFQGVGQVPGEAREEQKPVLREYAGHTPKPPRKKEKIIYDERLI